MKEIDLHDKLLLDLSLSKYSLAALAVADKINLFRAILDYDGNISKISTGLNIRQQGINALVYFLTAKGFLAINALKVSLTKVSSNYLLPDSDYYWGGAFVFSKIYDSPEYKQIFDSMHSTPARLEIQGNNVSEMWENGNLETEVAKVFTNAMQSLNHPAATLAIKSGVFAGINCLLDIGGGSGCFVKAFIDEYPDKHATIYELPEVCRLIEKDLSRKNISLSSGNFFTDDLPRGHDGILFSNILHDWQLDKVHLLLKKAYDALPIGGKIFIHEVLLDEDKCGPEYATAFNLLMYINHGSQQYTQNELFNFLSECGFKNLKATKTHVYYSVVSGVK